MKLTIDFETRSRADIRKCGAWLYSLDPSTDVTTISWSDGDWETGQWRMGDAPPAELHALVASADAVEAHNSFFEIAIWENVCAARYGWPAINRRKWRCSAAKAAACGLSRALGNAGRAIGAAVVKDEADGRWAMQKVARPRPKTGEWQTQEEDWQKMLEYNRRDVASEESLSAALPDLSATELAAWQASERMNARGMMIDVAGCEAAVRLAGEHARKLTAEFQQITGLETAGQRAKFIVWMANRGFQLPNTRAGTLDEFLRVNADSAEQEVRAVKIVRALGRSSIKKYRACLDMTAPDGRARGCFVYHGAHTGRWAGRGLQPQNFKRDCRWKMESAWRDIRDMDLESVEFVYGDPLEFLGEVTRGAIVAAPGTRFLVGDYAQIEARMVFWLAGERRGLDTFRRGEDMYLDMASTIWNRRVVKAESDKRFIGKHAILGLGFGAGYIKFLMHIRELGAPKFTTQQIHEIVPAGWRAATLRWILNEGWADVRRKMPDATRADAEELVLTKWIVDKYRKTYESVVKLWRAAEDAVRSAIRNPGTTHKVASGKLSYTCGKKFLNCRLPSGRVMRYRGPQLSADESISYMTPDDNRRTTYGGSLIENAVQAASRDVMAEAMVRLDRSEDYCDLVATIHDELIVESSTGTLDEFVDIMAAPPAWCPDLPVKVDGWSGTRYKKG